MGFAKYATSATKMPTGCFGFRGMVFAVKGLLGFYEAQVTSVQGMAMMICFEMIGATP